MAEAPHLRPWKTLSSRPIYENKWMHLREDVAELPDGRTTIYGVVTFGDCVGVVPLLPDDRVVLVRQWRYVQRDARWEIPTGGVHAGEAIEAAAQRELAEETGYQAGRLRFLCSYYTSKSVCRETARLYLGEGYRRPRCRATRRSSWRSRRSRSRRRCGWRPTGRSWTA